MALGQDEIGKRFGSHKGTVDCPNSTSPKHHDLRLSFIGFAKLLDDLLPDGRAKSIAFKELEDSSMWANKAIAESAPLSKD